MNNEKFFNDSPSVMSSLSEKFQNGDYDEFIEIASTLEGQFSNNPSYDLMCGISYSCLGRKDEAEIFFEKLLSTGFATANHLCLLGVFCAESGEYHIASQSFQQALELQPDNPEIQKNLGLSLFELGDARQAMDYLFESAKHRSEFEKIYVDKSILSFAKGANDDHVARLRRALRMRPADFGVLANLAAALHNAGNVEEAITHYRDAIELCPSNTEVMMNFSAALLLAGKIAAAIKINERALEIDPDNTANRRNLADLCFRAKHYSRANRLLAEFGDANSVAKRAECLHQLGERDGLISHLCRSAKRDPFNIRLSAVSSFASSQYRFKDPMSFCADACRLVSHENITDELSDWEAFKGALSTLLETETMFWNPVNSTTINGKQTKENIFSREVQGLSELRDLLLRRIGTYRRKNLSGSGYIESAWPSQNELVGWVVDMLVGGYQESHVHPSGWVSGVLYIDTIPQPVNNEGALLVSERGHNLKTNGQKFFSRLIQPKEGDIVLFPSSVFHSTLPVVSSGQRRVLAFDLRPLV